MTIEELDLYDKLCRKAASQHLTRSEEEAMNKLGKKKVEFLKKDLPDYYKGKPGYGKDYIMDPDRK